MYFKVIILKFNRRYKIQQRILIYLLVIILISISIFQPIFEFKDSIMVHEDTPFIGLTPSFTQYMNSLYDNLFIYNNLDYSGVIQRGMIGPLNYLFELLFLPSTINNGIIANILENTAFLLIGSLSMFLFIYKLFEKENYSIRIISSFIGTLIFFPFIGAESAFLPLCFIFVLSIIKRFNNNLFKLRYNLLVLSGLITSISLLFAFGGYNYLLQNFILFILLIIILPIFISKRKLNLFFILLFALIFGVLINSIIFYGSYLLSISKSANNSYYSFMKSLSVPFGKSNILYALQILPQLQQPTLFILKLILFIFCISGLIIYFNKKRTLKLDNLILIISLLIIFIFITFFYNTVYKPFGSIFKLLVLHFKFLYAIRSGNGSFSYLIGFILGVFSSVAIVSYRNYLKNNNLLFVLLVLILIVIGFGTFYYNNILPYTNINYFYVKVPSHVYSLSNYINNRSGYFNVGILPSAAGFQYLDTWYTGTNIYSYLINKPVYTGGYIAQSEIFYPITKSFYDEISSNIENNNKLNRNYMSSIFGILGIKYILVQSNALKSSPYDPNYYDLFQLNYIYANINKSYNIKFVKNYSNTSLYENLNYVPLIYATNVYNIGNSSDTELVNLITNQSFDIKMDSAYVTYIPGFYNDSNTINASRIENFKEPEINFTYNNPTLVTVKIRNATTPFYLVFRETYGTHWHAYINGKLVPLKDHIAVNGFANAWYINKTGNYTVTIYYTQQTYAWIAFAVSFAALFATIGLGVYGWFENKKVKPVKSRIIHAKDLEV